MNTKEPSISQSERDKKQWEKWKHLIYAAETLSERGRNPHSIRKVVECLNSIEEVFPKTLDPIEDFEGFALRQFVKALKSSLVQLP